MFGIIGGTIVGYHILMIMISENAFKQKEPWAYRALWFGLLSWFAIDSGISIYYGAIHRFGHHKCSHFSTYRITATNDKK